MRFAPTIKRTRPRAGCKFAAAVILSRLPEQTAFDEPANRVRSDNMDLLN
jgi:hypothetical protein